MFADDVKLGSVNWEQGMLLTPEHFLRQERYVDSRFLWLLRYTTVCYGLIGGGPRLPGVERGAKGDDPVVSVNDDSAGISITVAQCRGITPAGCFVDIQPERPVYLEVPKQALDGVAESRIYIVCDPHGKELFEPGDDGLNPQQEKEWYPGYRLSLKLDADQVPYALSVGRIVRARDGVEFDRDPDFIPACAFVDAHSELSASARAIQDAMIRLASRFTELHRAMRYFVSRFKERGVETDNDLDMLAFVGRMVMASQNCVYEVMDTTQAPQAFFGHLRRFIHSAAVYLDLSPPVRQYFDLLKDTGETEFIALLAQQKKALSASPKWRIYEDLADEVDSAIHSIAALQKLEQALEGKYIDFRINPVLEAMNFIFDRDGEVLYKLHAKSTRVQGTDDMRTMTFAKLQLEGREKYRLVLVGEDNAIFDREIKLELQINENSGYKDKARWLSCVPKPDQCNFDFDFDAPDAVPTINDLRATLTADHPIKVGMLFVRQRFYADRQQQPTAQPKPEGRTRVGSGKEDFPGRARSEVFPNSERTAARRWRTFGSEPTAREDETLRAPRDRESAGRSDREPEQERRRANWDDPSGRSSREYDRESQQRGDSDSSQDRTWDGRRGEDLRRNDEDQPPLPPARRRRVQD